MNGYIYNIETRSIATKIENVTKCNDTTIKGENAKAKIGTGLYIISDQEYAEGDILPVDIEDKRAKIPTLIEAD